MTETQELIPLHEDLWVSSQPLSFFGMELGARMTVVRFGSDLLLHSPIKPNPKLKEELGELGELRWVIGPNKWHHLYLKDWMDLGAQAWGVEGLQKKRSDLQFDGLVGEQDPWPDSFTTHSFSCIPFSDEAVFVHAPSKTLVVTDLVFNLQPSAPLMTRARMWTAGAYPGVRCSTLERIVMRREEGRAALTDVLSHDFDRIILAHGDIVESGGKDALRNAYSWALPK